MCEVDLPKRSPFCLHLPRSRLVVCLVHVFCHDAASAKVEVWTNEGDGLAGRLLFRELT